MKLFVVIPMHECRREQAKILEILINKTEFRNKIMDELSKLLQSKAQELILGYKDISNETI
jgi:hypothetical protein